jgi:hypothetical protein
VGIVEERESILTIEVVFFIVISHSLSSFAQISYVRIIRLPHVQLEFDFCGFEISA